jgi:hypothetical protein
MDQNSPERAADSSAAGTAPATAADAPTAAPAPAHPWWRVPGGSLIAIGATCGVAWAAGFRAYMVELVGTDSTFTWDGTVGAILLPGAVVGGLLGWAESLRRNGDDTRRRWLALSPLVLAVAPLLRPGAVVELFTTGNGGAAIGVVLLGIGGGYAISGRGRRWGRVVAGVLSGAAVGAVALMPGIIGGDRLSVTNPRGAWVTVLAASFLALLVLASSIPFRAAEQGVAASGLPDAVAP